MSALKATDPFAVSLLLSDEIYFIKKEQEMPPVHTAGIEEEEIRRLHFNYLGENNKYLLLAVNEQEYETIGPKSLESLNGILKAKNMELRDVAVVNLDRYPGVGYDDLKLFFAPARVVLFGINPESIGLPAFAGNTIADYSGTRILATFSFTEMHNDNNRKRLFWNEMKRL